MSEERRTPIVLAKSILALLIAIVLFVIITLLGTLVGRLVGREAFFIDIAVPLVAAYVGPLLAVSIFEKSCNYHFVGIGFVVMTLGLVVYYIKFMDPVLAKAGLSQFERTWDTLSVSAIAVGGLFSYGKIWWSRGSPM